MDLEPGIAVPPYGPDPKRIGMAFSNLEAHLCGIAAPAFTDMVLAV